MLTKYSPLSSARAEIRGVAAVECTQEVAFAQFAAMLEHGGVFGSPIANGRWLFLSHEPPEDRVDIEPSFLSPEWDAIVAHEAENWYVMFFFETRAIALELFEAMRSGADVDPILDRVGGGVDAGLGGSQLVRSNRLHVTGMRRKRDEKVFSTSARVCTSRKWSVDPVESAPTRRLPR